MSKVISKIIKGFYEPAVEEDSGEKLKVNSVVGKAAFVYEKIRNAVDYQEEHLVRKNAIYRILKRKLLFEKVILENYLLEKYHHENMTRHLIMELMRAGYLTKDVPLKMVDVVDAIVQKYNKLITKIKETDGRVDRKTYRWLLEMTAVEIENALIPSHKEKALINAMFSVYNPRVEINDLEDKEKELQVYLACHKALYKWDDAMLRFLLLNLYYPNWKSPDAKLFVKLSADINEVRANFDKQLQSSWQKRIMKVLLKKAIIFWILVDVIENNKNEAEQIFDDPELLEAEIKKAINKRCKGVRVKLSRGVVRSIIYVFFTKMILALAIEFPMDWYLLGAVNYFTAAVNIGFPPVLMFLVAILIRMPKKENTNAIIEEIKNIALRDGDGKTFKLKYPLGRGGIMRFSFNLIYALTFVFSIIIIFWGLYQFGFNVVSSLIFVLFLTLVSFFGIRIRRPVQDLLTIDRRESIIGSIVDFFALPFVSMGRWMSGKFSKINVVAYFLDLIIEAPFKLLIEVFEDLFGFIREKKEDVMNE